MTSSTADMLRINGGLWVPLSRDQRKTFTLTEPQPTYVSARGTRGNIPPRSTFVISPPGSSS